MEPIGVLAPATTANLGPGFDCLGMALDLWNRIDVMSGSSNDENGPLVEISGQGIGELGQALGDGSNRIGNPRRGFESLQLQQPYRSKNF